MLQYINSLRAKFSAAIAEIFLLLNLILYFVEINCYNSVYIKMDLTMAFDLCGMVILFPPPSGQCWSQR